MMVIDDPRKPETPATPFSADDPWDGWQPRWKDGDAVRQQENHSPTRPLALRGTPQSSAARQRIVDARLWEMMTPAQQDAALQISLAFETMGRGLGYVLSSWQRIPGCRGQTNAAAAHGRLIRGYIDWTKACHRKKISHAMVVDILVFGFSCRAQDRDRRQRRGTARANLLDGLALYCALKGWT